MTQNWVIKLYEVQNVVIWALIL